MTYRILCIGIKPVLHKSHFEAVFHSKPPFIVVVVRKSKGLSLLLSVL